MKPKLMDAEIYFHCKPCGFKVGFALNNVAFTAWARGDTQRQVNCDQCGKLIGQIFYQFE